MKKLMAMMVAGVMTAAMVTGCGGGSGTPADAPAETVAPSEDGSAEDANAEATDTESGQEEAAVSGDSDLEYVKEKGTLVVGITDFEPMDYKDESGSWIGFDADMASAFAESLGVSVEFV